MRSNHWHLTKTLAVAAMAAAVVACSGVDVTGTESGLPAGPELPVGGSPGGGDSTVSFQDPVVIGSWTRLLFFTDLDGTQRGSRLTFDFRADSTFTRRLVSSNFTQGLEDTIVESGRWSTQSGTLILRYNPGTPTESTSRFSYRIARRADGTSVLLLDDSGFVRD